MRRIDTAGAPAKTAAIAKGRFSLCVQAAAASLQSLLLPIEKKKKLKLEQTLHIKRVSWIHQGTIATDQKNQAVGANIMNVSHSRREREQNERGKGGEEWEKEGKKGIL